MFGKKKVKDSDCIVVGFAYFYSKQKDHEFTVKQVSDITEYAKVVSEVFTELNVTKKTPVRALLLRGQYTNIQIDKPKTPEEEMAGAVQWAIKDYVQDTVTNFAVDVSAQKRIVKAIIDAVTEHAALSDISVEEISLADLFDENDEQAHIILFQPEGYDLNLITIWHSRLFFTRSLRGFKDLYKYQKGSIDNDMFDNLSLELQRSLDYMVAQLKLPAPKLLTIALDCPDRESIADYLTNTYSFQTNVISEEVGKNSVIYLSLVALAKAGKKA